MTSPHDTRAPAFADAPLALRHNRLLASLPAPTLARLAERLTIVRVEPGPVAGRAAEWQRPGRLCFPLTAVFGMCWVDAHGASVDLTTVGSEGALGTVAVLGEDALPLPPLPAVEARVRIAGEVALTPVDRIDPGLGEALRALAVRALATLAQQLTLAIVCREQHDARARTAEMLLRCADQTGAHELQLTQEALAELLGVRRATVNAAASALQRAGAVRYRRGRIQLLDPDRLEHDACPCRPLRRSLAFHLEPAAVSPGS